MTQVPNIPPLIESEPRDFEDTGITSTVSVAGHPLHPLLVTFPVAFLVGAAATDIGFWSSNDAFWARASLWLIGAGFITGIVAALTGILDFLKIDRVRKRSAGWVHLFGNVAALLITLVNWILRYSNPVEAVIPQGIVLSILVSVILGVTGWYGGELAYRHKIGVVGRGSRREPS
ncbi:DUF2231 domain-containing protein [Altericista sp. CCNU0014]|uniref:DUF2231 domain-containing protein n=1 Tax=Altericista sp. CCNU0014 TaxID=3082949 RepID=UPI00384DDCA4